VIPKGESEPRTYEIQRDPTRAWLRAVLDAADPDPWRQRVRQAFDYQDSKEQRAVLEALADEADIGRQPVRVLTNLADRLEMLQAGDLAIKLLRKVQQRHPSDPWTNSSLANLLRTSRPPHLEDAIRYYTAAVALRPDSSGLHVNLAVALYEQGKVEEAIAENREALRIDPLYTTPRCNLVDSLIKSGKNEEAEAVAREGVRLKPNEAAFHHNLGHALQELGKSEEAIAEYSEALRLDPELVSAHIQLAADLFKKGKRDESLAKFRELVRMDPNSACTHYNLGVTLGLLGRTDEALEEYRDTLRLMPDYIPALVNLAQILTDQGKPEEVVAAYRKALHHRPDAIENRINFAVRLAEQGQMQEAITEAREAIRLYPRFEYAYNILGTMLLAQVELDDAIVCFQQAINLDKGYAEAQRNLDRALRMKGVLDKLPAIQRGEVAVADVDEQLALAELCRYKRLYATATRSMRDALAARPTLADNPFSVHRYNAACWAALAGCGAGEDATKLTDVDRAGFRQQALDWLRADLGAWRGLLHKQPDEARPEVAQTMRHWLIDRDFNGVRGTQALAKLPEAERQPWQKLWNDVADLLKRAEAKPTPEK